MRIATHGSTGTYLVMPAISFTLAPPADQRDSLIIQNEIGVLYVKLGSDCTAVDHTYRLNSWANLEIPKSWQGAVSVCRAVDSGLVRCTETK